VANDFARIAWRCRRGTLELDLMLQRFLANGYPGLNEQERGDFSRLLEVQDPLLMDWLQGRGMPPMELERIVARIRAIVTSGDPA